MSRMRLLQVRRTGRGLRLVWKCPRAALGALLHNRGNTTYTAGARGRHTPVRCDAHREQAATKDAGTTVSVIRLALTIADSLDHGVLRKLILYLRELGISRNEILRLRLSEPEDIDTILGTAGQEHGEKD
jgi:hypothetical protein